MAYLNNKLNNKDNEFIDNFSKMLEKNNYQYLNGK